jgi:serine/threonine protein kinase
MISRNMATKQLKTLISGSFHTENAMKLVRLGADPDTKDDKGNSLLHILMRGNQDGINDDFIDELVKTYNANIYIQHELKQEKVGNILPVAYQMDPQQLKDQLKKESIIGKGHFANVYLSKWDSENVVIKKITFNKLQYNLKSYHNEMSCMHELTEAKVPNVIKFVGFAIQRPDYYIVMEYAPLGSLGDYIQKHSNLPLNWGERYEIIKGMINGLKWIHQHDFIHRDIKTANILMDQNMQPKIADFGFSIKKNEKSTRISGTPLYMAPEAFEGNFSEKSDIFSLAITTWEVGTWENIDNEYPATLNANDMYHYIKLGNRASIPTTCPPKIAGLIRWCWEDKPNNRPATAELQNELNSGVDTVSEKLDMLERNRSFTLKC